MSPNVCSNVDEITSHEGHYVHLNCISDVSQGQTDGHTHQRDHIDEGIPEDRLAAVEFILHQDADIAHFSWDFVSEDSYEDCNVLIFFPGGEGCPHCQTIEEIMDK